MAPNTAELPHNQQPLVIPVAAPPTPPTPYNEPGQPNVIYIMADQMAAPLLKMHWPESPIITPNLDALASEGVVFDKAYCNAPLCAPSRFCMVSGQLPSKIGAYDNASMLSSDIPTYAHMLRSEGYQTALAGKMHFIGPDQLHGFEDRLTSDIYPADFGWAVNWDNPEQRLEWYHNMSSVFQAGPCVRSNQLDYDEEVVYKSTQYIYDYARQKPSQRRPLSLTVSLTHPHDPYAITKDLWDLYENVEIPLPTVTIPEAEQDPHSVRILKCIDAWGKEVPTEAVLRARRAYFASCTYVDLQVGRILKALRDCQLLDNTVIVFSGDHGDMLGERNLWYKMSWFESSARVPFLISSPGRFAPHRVPQVVSTMDIPLTFLEIAAGKDAVKKWSDLIDFDGQSLYPALLGQPIRDETFGEYMGEGSVTPVVMIRRGRWKFITSLIDPPQLFDLETDPRELVNLADHTTRQKLEAVFSNIDINIDEVFGKFTAEAAHKWDLKSIHNDAVTAQRRRRLCWNGLTKGRYEPWDFEGTGGGRSKYIRSNIPLDDLELKARFPPVDDYGRAMPPGYLPPLAGVSLR